MANKVITGLGVHHIALRSSDFDRSLEFYKKLGLCEFASWGEGTGRGVLLDISDGAKLELFANGSDSYQAEGKYAHIALCTDDVDAAYALALSAGAAAHIAPETVTIGSGERTFDARIAFVKGPDGELVEFFKEL